MPVIAKTLVLLILSNIFMTFAWYAHLMKEPVRLNYLCAAVCMCGAVFLVFRR